MSEIWKDIPGYEGSYQVSNYGKVKSLNREITAGGAIKNRAVRERILKQGRNSKGYYHFVVSKNGETKIIRTHRIIAKLFIPNPSGFSEVNHKNETKSNNSAANLEWCNRQFNLQYGTGRKRLSNTLKGRKRPDLAGEKCASSKLKDFQVIAIYFDKRKYKEISKEYGIVFSCISKIKHKKAWNHLVDKL